MNEFELPANLEKHFNIHGHKAVEKYEKDGFTVFISEGGPFDRDNERPFFETAFALYNRDVLFYQPIEFDYSHDIDRTILGRREARINTAKKAANLTIEDFNRAYIQ